MSEHEPEETPREEGEEDLEAHVLKEALAAGAASAALFAGQAAAQTPPPGNAVSSATVRAFQAQAPEELAAGAERLAESARSVEAQLAMLESASSEDPELSLVYAGRVEEATRTMIESQWSAFVSQAAATGGATDPNALVQYVLRESYLQTTEDLTVYAEKVKYYNESRKYTRDEDILASLKRDVMTTLYAADLLASLERA